MTPQERSDAVVAGYLKDVRGNVPEDEARRLSESIRVALVEATNDEVEKRRAVEKALRQRGYIVAALLGVIDGERGAA